MHSEVFERWLGSGFTQLKATLYYSYNCLSLRTEIYVYNANLILKVNCIVVWSQVMNSS